MRIVSVTCEERSVYEHSAPDSETLYVEHRSYVMRRLLQAGLTRDEAKDATQDLFLRVHSHRARLSHVVNWRAWFHVVATRAAVSLRRRAHHKRELSWESAVATTPQAEPTQLEDASQEEATKALHHTLSSLPPAMQSLLTLHYLEQVPVKQLAKLTARPCMHA